MNSAAPIHAPVPVWLGRRVAVVGLGESGLAASRLLLGQGASVWACDEADRPGLRSALEGLSASGARVQLACAALPEEPLDTVVASPGVPPASPLLRGAAARAIPVIGELELGFRHSRCPSLAITGTNGKTTTTELTERLLLRAGKRTVAAGNIGLPSCAVADRSGEFDYLTLEVSSFQLETVEFFRPVVAVLLNLTPDHFDRYSGMDDYIRAKARVFLNQQADDWALVQWEALERMRAMGLGIPSRLVTFSARASDADLCVEGRRVLSRHPAFPGSLLDLDSVALRGPHNAENLMAAFGIALCLGLDRDAARDALASYTPAPHRCEAVAEVDGVKFVNDSKATNIDAVRQALLTIEAGPAGAPNIWLIAGGKDKGFDYGDLGPLLAERVRGTFLIGETQAKLRGAWEAFTPCVGAGSMLEAVTKAAQAATRGEVVLLSPACSSFDMFQNYRHRGDVFRQAVQDWARQRGSTCCPANDNQKGDRISPSAAPPIEAFESVRNQQTDAPQRRDNP